MSPVKRQLQDENLFLKKEENWQKLKETIAMHKKLKKKEKCLKIYIYLIYLFKNVLKFFIISYHNTENNDRLNFYATYVYRQAIQIAIWGKVKKYFQCRSQFFERCFSVRFMIFRNTRLRKHYCIHVFIPFQIFYKP